MKRLLSPATNATGLTTALLILYAIAQAVLNHLGYHVGLTSAQLAAVVAAAVGYARTQVTPVADPRDGNGKPLMTAAELVAVEQSARQAYQDASDKLAALSVLGAPPPTPVTQPVPPGGGQAS